MSLVRIIATKVARSTQTNPTYFAQYVNKLSSTACYMPGFIGAKSYWKVGDHMTIISISDWTSNDAWKQWVDSEKRKTICLEYDSKTLSTDNFDVLIKREKTNNIFLL